MTDVTVMAAYASVVEDDGHLFVGFAQGEDADEPYVLFRQSLSGGPIWFEISDEDLGAEDAVERVTYTADGIEIAIKPEASAALGYVQRVAVRMGPDCDSGPEAVAALQEMFG
jgi:hypothetical protein